MEGFCPKCDNNKIKSKENLPFGEEVICAMCGANLIWEYDYGTDYDLNFWLEENKDAPKTKD